LVVARFNSFVVVATEAIVPGLRGSLANLLGEGDLNQTASETGS
jgi:hypothetical protein